MKPPDSSVCVCPCFLFMKQATFFSFQVLCAPWWATCFFFFDFTFHFHAFFLYHFLFFVNLHVFFIFMFLFDFLKIIHFLCLHFCNSAKFRVFAVCEAFISCGNVVVGSLVVLLAKGARVYCGY